MASETLTPMQQELLNRADSIVASISQTVVAATDFAAEQIPDIALQYVMYGRAAYSIYVIIGVALVIGGLVLWRSMHSGQEPEDWAIRFAASAVSVTTGAVVVLCNLNSALMVWFAPKVWLLNELVNMVKIQH